MTSDKPDRIGDPAPQLSIILATFNERENLPQLLDRIEATALPPLELVVVDDGSTDGTRQFLEQRARSDGRLRLFWHDGKQTTLRAQCQGIAAARGRYLVIMDSDLQHPPEVLPAMVDALSKGSALVVGSRYAPGGSAGPRARTRLAISRGAEWTAKAFLPEARRVSDPVSGFFAFRRETFQPLPPEWRGYKLLLFLLVMSRGSPVAEVGYRFEPRASGASKVTENTRFIHFFLTEVVLARRFRRMLAARSSNEVTPRESAS
jgi:dolichol-phosphate mannosyltransferase